MSNAERKANLPAIIKTVEPNFTELARRHNVADFTFAREAGFALQILKENEYLAQVACGNPDSLKEAIINVAAIGLSLSPIFKFAFLIPRLRKVCLDISYQGYIELATSKGIILWAKAEIVRDSDEFEHLGVNQAPHHKYQPFADRGAIIGGYVIAKMPSGDLLVDFMSIADIYKIRDRSEGWKAYIDKKIRSTPWNSDEDEMVKKTLIRRAQKSWPKSATREALDRAVAAADDAAGVDLNTPAALPPAPLNDHQAEGFQLIRELLTTLKRSEDAFVTHLCRTTNRKILKLEDLTELEITQAVAMLEGFLSAQAAREAAEAKKKGEKEKNENAG